MLAAQFFYGNNKKIILFLFFLILSLIATYRSELKWSLLFLQQLLKGQISSPNERQAFLEAKKLIKNDSFPFAIQEILKIEPQSEANLLMADFYYDKGDYSEALSWYKKFLKIDPYSFNAHRGILKCLEKLHMFEDFINHRHHAIQMFEMAAEKFRPQLNPSVEEKFNRKAIYVYEEFLAALNKLKTKH